MEGRGSRDGMERGAEILGSDGNSLHLGGCLGIHLSNSDEQYT